MHDGALQVLKLLPHDALVPILLSILQNHIAQMRNYRHGISRAGFTAFEELKLLPQSVLIPHVAALVEMAPRGPS